MQNCSITFFKSTCMFYPVYGTAAATLKGLINSDTLSCLETDIKRKGNSEVTVLVIFLSGLGLG